jgi:hypothetical protein
MGSVRLWGTPPYCTKGARAQAQFHHQQHSIPPIIGHPLQRYHQQIFFLTYTEKASSLILLQCFRELHSQCPATFDEGPCNVCRGVGENYSAAGVVPSAFGRGWWECSDTLTQPQGREILYRDQVLTFYRCKRTQRASLQWILFICFQKKKKKERKEKKRAQWRGEQRPRMCHCAIGRATNDILSVPTRDTWPVLVPWHSRTMHVVPHIM